MPNGSTSDHCISVDTDQLSREMERKAQKLPEILNSTAGRSSCCIFRVPQSLVEINKAYEPQVVSIGPYHHGQSPCLQMIEEHKWRFLNDLLTRTNKNMKDLIDPVAQREKEVRESYSGAVAFDGKKLIEIMVLDGCFIIELFRKVRRGVNNNPVEPLLRMARLLSFVMRDLLRLENQIPYFVLETLFHLTVESLPNANNPPLIELALKFFNCLIQRPESALKQYYNLEPKHLLDLILLTYITQTAPPNNDIGCIPSKYLQPIPSATKLRLAGVMFNPLNSVNGNLLEIKFGHGALEIPKLIIDDFSSSLILNFVAFEQCYGHRSRHITDYCAFLGFLLSAPSDVALLSEKNIIQNYFGTDKEVVFFFKNMLKDAVHYIPESYLSKVFVGVNRYCDSQLHLKWAGFKHKYCDAPWTVLSVLAASLLLLLTAAGTVFSGFQYFDPNTSN